jgi:hypothetical protein
MAGNDEGLREPGAIAPHRADYLPDAWRGWAVWELGCWVHLLTRRAGMRADPRKAEKDLYDARTFAALIQAHLDAARGEKG